MADVFGHMHLQILGDNRLANAQYLVNFVGEAEILERLHEGEERCWYASTLR